jgi:hypothetical protein
MSGAITLLLLCAFMAWTGKTLRVSTIKCHHKVIDYENKKDGS